MKAHSHEFDQLRDNFERGMKGHPRISVNLSRSSRDCKQSFYESGETDKLFHAYMMGYAYAKCLNRSGDLPLKED